MTNNIPVWILTFNRPTALNRLIDHFAKEEMPVNVFSNHPDVVISPANRAYVDRVITNTLNFRDSNSWCARSWNTIMMKCFDSGQVNDAILIQDDTDIKPGFGKWINEQSQKFDFIWGPAGDQFHYLKFDVFKRTGYWDERYIGCYAADCDFMKRVCIAYNNVKMVEKLSIQDSHPWGFTHNPCGVDAFIQTEMHSKTIDPTYENQHWQLEKQGPVNTTLIAAQNHYQKKWRAAIDNSGPCIIASIRYLDEIDWYPFFTKKHGITVDHEVMC